MESNFKRRLIAGLFVPVLGLSVGAALAQSGSSGASGSGTSASGSMSGGTTGSGSMSGGTSGSSASGGSGSTSGASTMGAGTSAGSKGSATTGTSAAGGSSGSASWNAQTFDRLDTNRDGTLTREEAMADPSMRDAWSRLDSKSTGRVSRSDFDRFRTTMGSGAQSGNAGATTGSGAKAQGQGSTPGSTGTSK
jgi:hypothetical protein